MGSSVTSFSGLSAANIAALFGTAGSSAAAKDGASTSVAGAAGTSITGAGGGGTNAAKAIQAIVTQIQLEEMQTISQGKSSTLSLASVASTYEKTASVPSGTVAVSVTKLDSVVTAHGDDLASAVGTLMAQVQAQEAQVEASKGGVLFTKDETAFGGRSGTSSDVWTANSVTLNMHETANVGLELSDEEGSLNNISNWVEAAQDFQAPSTTSTAATAKPTGPEDTSGSASNGSALYLELSVYHGSFGELVDKEDPLVSDFLKGALPGQNGSTPTNGGGFNYGWDGKDESAYGISGVMISNYDPAAVANRAEIFGGQIGQSAWMNADQQAAARGGTVVSDVTGWGGGGEVIGVVIPLKNS